MKFLHKRSMLLLRVSLGIVFFWFGILKLFSVSQDIYIIQKLVPFMPKFQLFTFLLAAIEIFIGGSFLSNKNVKLASIIMILLMSILTLSILITQGFTPRFPVLSFIGQDAIKNFVIMAAGLVLIADPTSTSE